MKFLEKVKRYRICSENSCYIVTNYLYIKAKIFSKEKNVKENEAQNFFYICTASIQLLIKPRTNLDKIFREGHISFNQIKQNQLGFSFLYIKSTNIISSMYKSLKS